MADEQGPTPELCTTWGRRKRHWSVNLKPTADRWKLDRPGRSGSSLCGQNVMDEARRNYSLRCYGHTTVVVADLPPCLSCERSLRAVSRDASNG